MMNCDKAKLLLSNYIDKTLEPEVKKEIDDFLETNAECSKLFADAMSVQSQLKSLPKVKPSEEFEASLRNRIIALNNGEEKQTFFNKKGLSLVFSGAALVTMLFMFVFTDVGIQQNISDEILPSSTISNPPSVDDEKLVDGKKDEATSVADADSVVNPPEKVDNSRIRLTGEND